MSDQGATAGSPPGGDAAPATGADGAAPADAGQPAVGDAGQSAPAPAADAGAAPAGDGKGKPPAQEPPKRQPDLTGRLAELSRANRDAQKALKRAEAQATEAQAKAGKFDKLLERAKGGDDSVIDELFTEFGLNFERIVNHVASKENGEPSPEEKRDAEIAAIKKRLDAEAAAKAKAEAEAAAAKEQAALGELVSGIGQAIKANEAKFEICARLGEEAAREVYGEVLRAWNEAGRLPFEPGEYEQAVLAAADLVELRYEARGKLLVKQAKAAAAATEDKTGKNGAASKGGRKKDPLEAVAEGGALSDKDQAIVDGLLDKTAPAEGSQRARPRGINSELRNGSPRVSSSSAGMDSRDALRDVLAANGLTPR